ncbi:MAG: HEAT repeat domain-containing protein [Bacteroidota bacterium]
MNEKEFKESVFDYVLGKLSKDKAEQIEIFLRENQDYQGEVDQLKAIYQVAVPTNIPTPSIKMDDKFHEFLEEEIQSNASRKALLVDLGKLFSLDHFFGKFSFATMMLLIGVGVGYFLMDNNSSIHDQLVELQKESDEVEEVRSKLVMALINQPSANKRLQGINEVEKLDQVTETVISALFKTLNNDQNTNVRLAAVGSLSKYTQNPKVREGLVNSLVQQDSPMVQIALAELMVALQERSSVESMQQMLQKPDLNTLAKEKLEQSINVLL